MKSILASLFSLIGSAFFVQFSGAAMTTLVAIVISGAGGDQSDVALVAASYSLGFIVGCFLTPPQITRIGLVRGYAASAGAMTIAIVAFEMLEGTAAWILLRFMMGFSFAAVLAVADAWISDKAPKEMRGRVFAVYSIALGLASILSQVFFLAVDAGEGEFVLTLAISMNLAVVLVALGTTKQPLLEQEAPRYLRPLTFVSLPATVTAFANGFCVTSLISIVPFYLTDHGVEENFVALVIAAIYLGRLCCQWPVGKYSDKMDRRTILLFLASVVIAVCVLSILFQGGQGANASGDRGVFIQGLVFLFAFLLGGGLYPMYSVATSLAFDRAEGRSIMEISTTLLVINSIGAIIGPVCIMIIASFAGDYALHVALILACSLIAVSCLVGRVTRPPVESPSPTVSTMPAHSLGMVEATAELVEEAIEEQETSNKAKSEPVPGV